MCSVPIRKMIPSDEHQETQKLNGKLVVFQRLVLACLPNYREVLVSTGGGPGDNYVLNGHVMALCDTCAHGLTPEKAQALHDEDMHEFGVPVHAAVNEVVKIDTQIGAV